MSQRLVIVGAGVVGSATGQAFSEKGTHVTFVDVNPDRLEQLRTQGFNAVLPGDLNLSGVDAVFISVPTPSGPNGQITTYLEAATESIGHALKGIGDYDYPVVVFRCTQLPGMTATLTDLLEDISGKKAGIHFGVVYNPEYLRAENPTPDKNPLADSRKPLIVTIGHDLGDERSLSVMQSLYAPFGAPMVYTTVLTAELQKYFHNVYNAVKVSFFNGLRMYFAQFGLSEEQLQEIFRNRALSETILVQYTEEFRLLCKLYGLNDQDVRQIIGISKIACEGMRNPKYGTRNLGPYNGHCLPKEVIATLALAKDRGLEMPIVALTHEINERMKSFYVPSE